MPSSKENEDTFTSLAEGSTDSAAVKQYYDNWAKDYDQTLDDWEYRTPADAAALICPQLSSGSRILDRATKELVSRLRFDAPPKELDSSSVPVHVIAPVDYDLSNS